MRKRPDADANVPAWARRAPGPADPDRLGVLRDEDGLPIRDANGVLETIASLKARAEPLVQARLEEERARFGPPTDDGSGSPRWRAR